MDENKMPPYLPPNTVVCQMASRKKKLAAILALVGALIFIGGLIITDGWAALMGATILAYTSAVLDSTIEICCECDDKKQRMAEILVIVVAFVAVVAAAVFWAEMKGIIAAALVVAFAAVGVVAAEVVRKV